MFVRINYASDIECLGEKFLGRGFSYILGKIVLLGGRVLVEESF